MIDGRIYTQTTVQAKEVMAGNCQIVNVSHPLSSRVIYCLTDLAVYYMREGVIELYYTIAHARGLWVVLEGKCSIFKKSRLKFQSTSLAHNDHAPSRLPSNVTFELLPRSLTCACFPML